MGTATAKQTRQQLELTRRSIEQNVDRIVARIRYELDWRARLRRDGAQIAAIGAAIVTVAVVTTVLRRRFRRPMDGYAVADFDKMDLKDVATELRAIRRELEKQRDGGGRIFRLAQTALGAAATSAGTVAATRLIGEEEPASKPEPAAPAAEAAPIA